MGLTPNLCKVIRHIVTTYLFLNYSQIISNYTNTVVDNSRSLPKPASIVQVSTHAQFLVVLEAVIGDVIIVFVERSPNADLSQVSWDGSTW